MVKVIRVRDAGRACGWGRVAGTAWVAGGWVVATGEEAKTWRRVGAMAAGASASQRCRREARSHCPRHRRRAGGNQMSTTRAQEPLARL